MYTSFFRPTIDSSDEVFIAVVCIYSLNCKTLSSKQRTIQIDSSSTFFEAASAHSALSARASVARSFLVESCINIACCGSGKWFVRFFTLALAHLSSAANTLVPSSSLNSSSILSLALDSSSSIDETPEEVLLLVGLNCMVDSPMGISQITPSLSSSFSFFSSFFTLFFSILFSSSSSCESHLPYMNFPVPFIFFAFGFSIISPSPPESIGEFFLFISFFPPPSSSKNESSISAD
ncbi:hypothetical protein PENTCL1PPCAC_27512, partial [Pristionchus entomophagus]